MCCNVLMGDKAAIKNVKYRYLRALDTKHWDDFADTLTDDIVGDYGSSLGESLRFTNRHRRRLRLVARGVAAVHQP
ncbi:nuclear transport factor 2 family protein, partial [Mycolicibacterium hippocampi]|uniref:nuclear transport factor 2 family protein n=1 Tax=Mycolicibacterium hippocampi TaxID=659824 RepID=UPI0021F3C296